MTAPSPQDALVIGAGGGIGAAFLKALADDPAYGRIHALSRQPVEAAPGIVSHRYDPSTDDGVLSALAPFAEEPIGLVLVTVGTLHDEAAGPEKTIKQLTSERFLEVMRINAVIPGLVGRALLPVFRRRPLTFAAISARVGSISDNRIGGWHSYRASKAALNMLVRNLSIEAQRLNENSIAVTLHPGTVDTALSEPFQGNVPEGKLFTPDYSAGKLLEVVRGLTPADSGRCFDYAGKEIAP